MPQDPSLLSEEAWLFAAGLALNDGVGRVPFNRIMANRESEPARDAGDEHPDAVMQAIGTP